KGQNWRNFRTEAQYRGEDVFRAMLSTTNLCDYFNSDLQKAFGVTQKLSILSLNNRTDDLQSYGARAGCTLPKDFKADKYQEDFANNGGWDAWNRLLETQNNPYGSSLSALDELNRQRSLEEQSALSDAEAGGGFMSRTKPCVARGGGVRCIVQGLNITPGDTLANAVKATFNEDLGSLATQKDLADSLSFIIERLSNRLLDLGKSEKDPTYDKDYTFSPAPVPTEEEGPGCGVTGLPMLYTSAVSTAVYQFINDPANEAIANGSAGVQSNIDAFLAGVISNFKAAVPNARAGRVKTCTGNVGTDAIMVGKNTDAQGEIYDLISGAGRDSGAPIKASTQVNGDEHADWSRLIESSGGPGAPGTPPGPGPGPGPEPSPETPPVI
ncbi:hypothetical protein KW791_03100, partial [Candidatus Parcubacteria bacterium]|nr:hypothetical protein [Candidatus Parcubacteria bacterium]